jgi:hypothetical protein
MGIPDKRPKSSDSGAVLMREFRSLRMSELQPLRPSGFWAGHSEDTKEHMPERKMGNGTAAEFSMGSRIIAESQYWRGIEPSQQHQGYADMAGKKGPLRGSIAAFSSPLNKHVGCYALRGICYTPGGWDPR